MDIILRAIEIEQDMFCSVLEGFIQSTLSKASSELWVYRLLCPLKLIHCLSHKCFFHWPWHLTGPSFNSVTFHHPAGSTWSSYLSRPACANPTALHRSRQPTWHPSNKCNPSNVTLFTNQGTLMTTEGKGLQSTMLGPLLEMNCKHFTYQRHGGLLGVSTESILEHKVPSIPPQNYLVASTIQPKRKNIPVEIGSISWLR